MPQRTQWSIGRLFLWVFVAALVASHVTSFYQRQIVGFTDFSLDGSDVKKWVKELDPSAKSHGGGGGSSRSVDSVDSHLDYLFTLKNATYQQLLGHLKSKICQKLNEQYWSVQGRSDGSDSFSVHAYNGHTHFRIYCWLVPNTEDSKIRQLERNGEAVTKIKILKVGYLKR